MLLLLLFLLLLPQKNDSANDSCGLTVEFVSNNFKNILKWSTPNKNGVSFNVQYKIYGTKPWIDKAECANITQDLCDLTKETSISSEQYYANVTMSSKDCNISNISPLFYPLRDNILDPPSVHLSSTSRSIAINITHVVENLNSIYAPEYEINISGIGKITSEEPYYKIEKLNPETKYCVSVTMLYHPRFISSNITCVTTRADDTTEATIRIMLYILAVILVIFIVFSTGYGVHKYIYADNLKQPQILNMASNNNNKVVLVKAHNVTINVMHIEPNKPPEESTMTADEEEKTWIMTNLYFKDSEYDGSHESGVTEDHGYVRLLEEVTTTRPQMSPYDMPHNLLEPSIKQTMAPLDIINTDEDLYGRIKCNTNILPIQVKKVEQANQKGEMTEETFSYLPKNDTALPKLEILHHELEETEDSSIRQDVLNINVPNGMDFSECDSLFVDWSPISHHLYIPNIINKTVDEVDREECQEGEGLLSNLYKPIQIEENSEELVYLEQRWELHVKE